MRSGVQVLVVVLIGFPAATVPSVLSVEGCEDALKVVCEDPRVKVLQLSQCDRFSPPGGGGGSGGDAAVAAQCTDGRQQRTFHFHREPPKHTNPNGPCSTSLTITIDPAANTPMVTELLATVGRVLQFPPARLADSKGNVLATHADLAALDDNTVLSIFEQDSSEDLLQRGGWADHANQDREQDPEQMKDQEHEKHRRTPSQEQGDLGDLTLPQAGGTCMLAILFNNAPFLFVLLLQEYFSCTSALAVQKVG
jgi:hypothetical protein